MNQNNIMVSIVCTTYNHENYIGDALKGFVSQRINFPIEILVMDDASTDGTADIIREYEKKYPELIKAIYQTTNQYSRGLKPGKQNRERAVGKYIAVCEGDDYWVDEYKLKKQVEYMEANPDCTFCFTNGYRCYGVNNLVKKKIVPWTKKSIVKKDSNIYDVGEIELLGYIPTCSFLWRNGSRMLPVSENAFKGDELLKISMTSHGYAYFINEPMVVYRINENSATGIWRNNLQEYSKFCDKFISLFSDLEKILDDEKSRNVMAMRVCQWKVNKYCFSDERDKLREIIRSGEIRNLKYGNTASRIFCTIKCHFPACFKLIRVFYRKIKAAVHGVR